MNNKLPSFVDVQITLCQFYIVKQDQITDLKRYGTFSYLISITGIVSRYRGPVQISNPWILCKIHKYKYGLITFMTHNIEQYLKNT